MCDDKCPCGFNHPELFLEARGPVSDLVSLLGTWWVWGLGSDLCWWTTAVTNVFLFGDLPPTVQSHPPPCFPPAVAPCAGRWVLLPPPPIARISLESTASCQVPEAVSSLKPRPHSGTPSMPCPGLAPVRTSRDLGTSEP